MKEISRDKRLNFPEKLWYLFYNFWRAVGGWRPGGTTFWWPAVVDDDTETVYRKIMDQFLLAFLPKLTAGEGKTVLDVGCGSGYIREHLTRIGFRGRYVGVDPSADWEGGQTHAFPNEMARVPIELFETADRFDLILSLTALEHVLDDGAAIERLRTLGRPGGHELHLVPASCPP